MATDKKPSAADGSPQEVERIRDIIFGPQMRTYEGQFETILSDLERLRQEIAQLDSKLATQDRNQGQKLQALERELRQTSQKLSAEKVDREMLGDLLIEMGGLLKTGGSFGDVVKGLLKPGKDK